MNLEPLKKYLPENAIPYLYEWLDATHLRIMVKHPRKTKLGDYRFDRLTQIHQITIDSGLPPYPFFFVMTHEIAHLIVQKNHPDGVKSHGEEWKNIFGKLLIQSLSVYPEELRPFIFRHAQNPKASVGADVKLHKRFFLNENQIERMLENLDEGQVFRLRKRIFKKGKKRKIRYICSELRTGRSYLISGQAVVDEIFSE